jgi:Protein ChrB, N-terminal
VATVSSRRWLLITVSTAGATASVRVQVWRRLRALGALYLQQSACLLPDQDRTRREVRRLLERVRAAGGTGRMLGVEVPARDEHAGLIAELNAARDIEYAEVVERTPALLAELASETARGRFTYAEVEESEADLARFRSWLAKITARDYFDAPGRAAAEAAIAECERALAAFEDAAWRADTTDSAAPTVPAGPGRRVGRALRAVPDPAERTR